MLVSDNAGCYRNSILSVVAPFIAKQNMLSVAKFIHSETQDGKSLLDVHFSIPMKHVSIYVAEGNYVTTPSDLFTALLSNGGLTNSMTELA